VSKWLQTGFWPPGACFPGERWSLRSADLGEVVVYCPECDLREFGGSDD
jgi:hypothetical protein